MPRYTYASLDTAVAPIACQPPRDSEEWGEGDGPDDDCAEVRASDDDEGL